MENKIYGTSFHRCHIARREKSVDSELELSTPTTSRAWVSLVEIPHLSSHGYIAADEASGFKDSYNTTQSKKRTGDGPGTFSSVSCFFVSPEILDFPLFFIGQNWIPGKQK